MGAIRAVLLLQDDTKSLKESARAQGERLTKLAEAHGALRDRVSRIEGMIEGVGMASRQRRIEE